MESCKDSQMLIPKKRRSNYETLVKEGKNVFIDKWYSYKEIKAIEHRTGIKARRGNFSKKEREIVEKELHDFLKRKDMSMEEFSRLLLKRRRSVKKRIGKLFKKIAKKLHNRPLRPVWQYMTIAYYPGHERRWTPEQDELLKELFVVYGPSWSKISREIEKPAIACRDRFVSIGRKDYNKGKWSDIENSILEDVVDRCKAKHDGRKSFWKEVSDMMGERSPMQCLARWEVLCYKKLINKSGMKRTWTDFDDFILLGRLYESGIEDISEISWRSLCEEGLGLEFWRPITLYRRWWVLKKRVYIDASTTMDDILEFLLLSYNDKISEWLKNPNMETVSFVNGVQNILKENVKPEHI